MTRPTVGIVGGGILGMTVALRLLQSGVHVSLFERSHDLFRADRARIVVRARSAPAAPTLVGATIHVHDGP